VNYYTIVVISSFGSVCNCCLLNQVSQVSYVLWSFQGYLQCHCVAVVISVNKLNSYCSSHVQHSEKPCLMFIVSCVLVQMTNGLLDTLQHHKASTSSQYFFGIEIINRGRVTQKVLPQVYLHNNTQ